MTRTLSTSIWLAAAVVVLAGGCATRTPVDYVATITAIEGRNAFIDPGNAGRPEAATVSRRVHNGDRFFTGPGTRMTVSFARGGYVELDENTDPRLIQELACLAISLFHKGKMFVDASGVCVDAIGTSSQQKSKVVYAVVPSGGYLQVTVVDGQVNFRQPAGAVVGAGYRLDAQGGRILGPGRAYEVTTEEVRNAVGWTNYYRTYRPQLPGFDAARPGTPVRPGVDVRPPPVRPIQ
jgi:hypothetical protein